MKTRLFCSDKVKVWGQSSLEKKEDQSKMNFLYIYITFDCHTLSVKTMKHLKRLNFLTLDREADRI